MLKSLMKALTPSIPKFETFAAEIITTAIKGAPVLALKKLDLFKRRAIPDGQNDPLTMGRVCLLEAILNVMNSGKLGAAEPLALAKEHLAAVSQDTANEDAAVSDLEAFLNDEFDGKLISQDSAVGRWLWSFRT